MKHGFIMILGLVMMYFIHKMNYLIMSRLSIIAYYISLVFLVYTLLAGVSAGDASRWIEIPGLGITFQTSDLAKLILMIFLARNLSKHQDKLNDFKTVLRYMILPVACVCVLIFPTNFSTAALVFFTSLVLMFVGGVSMRILLTIVGACLAFLLLIGVVIYTKPDIIKRGRTWKARIENFMSEDSQSNYQAEQAKIAIARGGFSGVGPGNSTQRGFLPQASSDFIFAIIIEEYGSVISIVVLFMYLIFFFRTIHFSKLAHHQFGCLMAVGLSLNLLMQALVNMAVAVNLFPVTGQPLPLISMGGTSFWFTCISLGFIVSVSKDAQKDKEEMKGGQLATA